MGVSVIRCVSLPLGWQPVRTPRMWSLSRWDSRCCKSGSLPNRWHSSRSQRCSALMMTWVDFKVELLGENERDVVEEPWCVSGCLLHTSWVGRQFLLNCPPLMSPMTQSVKGLNWTELRNRGSGTDLGDCFTNRSAVDHKDTDVGDDTSWFLGGGALLRREGENGGRWASDLEAEGTLHKFWMSRMQWMGVYTLLKMSVK